MEVNRVGNKQVEVSIKIGESNRNALFLYYDGSLLLVDSGEIMVSDRPKTNWEQHVLTAWLEANSYGRGCVIVESKTLEVLENSVRMEIK